MPVKKHLKYILDTVMILAMPVLMAYSLLGEALHEWLGIGVTIAFLVHHILNYHWIKGLFKGRYPVSRILNLVVNLLLAVVMILLPVSGILMSRHVLASWKIASLTGTARTVHLLISYWGYLLMSFHIGLHGGAMKGCLPKAKRHSAVYKTVGYFGLALVCGYGLYAFGRRNLADYLFLKSHFVFFDYSESVAFFLLDYLSIMILTACIGSVLTCLLRKVSGVGHFMWKGKTNEKK